MYGYIESEMPVVAHTMALYATLVVVIGVVDDQPYCAARYRRMCRGKGTHVGCQFPDPGPGASCQNYAPVKMDDDLKHFITHYINRRRQRVAAGLERVRGGLHLPKPAVMMLVEWDHELALLAQRLADQCTFAHDDCRATVRYPYAGQTVGEVRWRRTSSSDMVTAQRAIRRVFDAWWGEKRRVKPHQLTEPFRLTSKGSVWGHFSQLTVWSLRAVGCGAVLHGPSYPRLLFVCDFSHTNMLGQRTISPGALAPCPAHTARKTSLYPLLCAPVRYEARTDDDESYDDVEDTPTAEIVTQSVMVHNRNKTWEQSLKSTWNNSTAFNRGFKNRMESCTRSYEEALRQSTNAKLYHKLDRELELRKKAMSKDHVYGGRGRFAQGWRYSHDTEDGESPTYLRKSSQTLTSNGNQEGYAEITTIMPEQQYFKARHKWHQTRDRRKRPGANALLHASHVLCTSSRPVVSLMLDREDIDQLFQDTGFNPGWIKRPAS